MSDSLAISLILLYVICSTCYIFLIKVSANRLVLFGAVNLITIFFGLAFLPLVPPIPAAAWPYFIGSIVSYNLMLVFISKAYHHHDLSHAAPLMAAVKYILLIALAAYFFHESTTLMGWLGIVIVLAGISLQINFKRLFHTQHARAYGFILLAALFSASQIAFDIQGTRLCENPFSYIVYCMFLGVPVTLLAFFQYRRSITHLIKAEWKQIVLSSAFDNIGYACFLYVIFVLKILYIQPMTNLTIVAATLVGLFILKEEMKTRRILASLIIFAGLAVIQFGRIA